MREDDSNDLSTDEVFIAVAAEHRRAVIDVLLSDPAEYSLEKMAREVATRTNGTSPTEVDEETLQRIQVRLLHHHLPHLDDQNILQFDVEAGTIEPDENVDEIDPLL
ncbi:DUF7344 domain-containing protein [Halomarina litorea]|uniref:DUF7344 domain-containing protein n=1 Tax=Halomarina litorea TaxID=2961595 RepID=UPI0020C2DC7C|nr:hypothetical protein [Halomarina sp. BCD28]